MKNLFLLLITSVLFISCGQSTKNETVSEITTSGEITTSSENVTLNYATVDAKSFNFKNGYGEPVEVEFVNSTSYQEGVELDNTTLMNIQTSALTKAKHSLKNKLSYIPIKLSVMGNEGGYSATVTFRGKNAYGVEDELNGVWLYDDKGEFTKALGVR